MIHWNLINKNLLNIQRFRRKNYQNIFEIIIEGKKDKNDKSAKLKNIIS